MKDRRVELRKELRQATDEDILKRYCKLKGRLLSEERARFRRGDLTRQVMVDLIVNDETR